MTRGVFSLKSVLATIGFVLVALDCGRAKVSPSSSSAPAPAVPPPSALAAAPTAAPLPPSAQIEDERNTISVFRAAAASTVFVTQKRIVVDYFGGRALEVPSGTGTGFIWDELGHVVSNYHVVRGARGVSVTLHDHKTFDARIIGVEPRKDIAVLKIDAPKQAIHPVRLPGKGYLLEVGQKAIAIGNPFGLDQTLTTGVISAFGREVEGIGGVSIRDMVQTDAAINPGNSGGPLLDSAGQLIGMNTMIYSRSGASAGIGFAVPVSTIARVVPQIIKTGKAEQVGLGVTIDPMQRLERRAEIRGVIVLSVQADSPAAKAGLRGVDQTPNGIVLGDVIVEIDGERIEDYDDLYNTLDKHQPGDVVRVAVIRTGKKLTMPVELTLLQ